MIRQFLWLVLIVAGAAGFYSWQLLDQEQSGTPANQDSQPDYVAQDLTRMIYNEEGHLSDPGVDQPLLCCQHRRIGDNKREHQEAGRGDRQLSVITWINR